MNTLEINKDIFINLDNVSEIVFTGGTTSKAGVAGKRVIIITFSNGNTKEYYNNLSSERRLKEVLSQNSIKFVSYPE